jgi:hypothetical protein
MSSIIWVATQEIEVRKALCRIDWVSTGPWISFWSIVSETSVAIWLKFKFGHTGHRHPWSILFPCVCTISSAFAIFLNASWKLCSVTFCTTCSSAWTASFVSKWQPFNFIFNQGNRKVPGGYARVELVGMLLSYLTFSVLVSLDFSIGRIIALSHGHKHKSSSHH